MRSGLINRRSTVKGLLLVVVAAILAGCSGGTEIGNPQSGSVFASSAELETYLKQQYASNILPNETYELADVDAPADASNDVAPAGEGFSGVNIQEAGVGESDKALTDGEYLYVAGMDHVAIVDIAAPGAMETVTTVAVGGEVDTLYRYNDLLVVLYRPAGHTGTQWAPAPGTAPLMVGMPYWLPVDAKTGILLVDIADRRHPVPVKRFEIDGNLTATRLIDGRLVVVQRFLPDLPPIQLYYDGTTADRQAVVAANEAALAAATLDELLPSLAVADGTGALVDQGSLIAADGFYKPRYPGGGSLVTVTTIALSAPDFPLAGSGLVADVHHVYASRRALYAAAVGWETIADAGTSRTSREVTTLHKFSLDSERAELVASGQVAGSVLNQFSFGEHDGVLRMATTAGWGFGRTNTVYCLAPAGDNLEVIGSLDKLAPGEALYAARFVGTRGFLVTFVKVDPLFTLDLSDPTDPKLVGELKVPGYSDYIHVLDDHHLLTIGKDTTLADGVAWYQGLQLSIFDIEEFANPRLLHTAAIGDRGTHSEALYNHKAFTFWAAENLLAFPVDLYEHPSAPDAPWEYGDYVHSGLYVYRVSPDSGFDALGRITTTDSGAGFVYTDWMRGIFVDRHVFAVTADAVRAAETDDIAAGVSTLELEGAVE